MLYALVSIGILTAYKKEDFMLTKNIDYVCGYSVMTAEEDARLSALEERFNSILAEINRASEQYGIEMLGVRFYDGAPTAYEPAATENNLAIVREHFPEYFEIGQQMDDLVKLGDTRYINSFKDNPRSVWDDVLTISDYAKEQGAIAYDVRYKDESREAYTHYTIHECFSYPLEVMQHYDLQDMIDRVEELAERLFNEVVSEFTGPSAIAKYLAGEGEAPQELYDVMKRVQEADKLNNKESQPSSIIPTKEARPKLEKVKHRSVFEMQNTAMYNSMGAVIDGMFTEDNNGQITLISDKSDVVVSSRKANTSVVSTYCITYIGDLDIKTARLSAFDRVVYESVCNLVESGNMEFSIADIFRRMNGDISKAPSSAQANSIELSLQRLSGHRIEIDLQGEIESRQLTINDKRVVGGRVNDTYISYRLGELELANGSKVTAVIMKDRPFLMVYAKARKQIKNVPIQALAVEGCSITAKSTIAKHFLAKRVELIRDKSLNNNRINFDSVYSEMNGGRPLSHAKSATEKMRDRDICSRILAYWKDIGYIDEVKEVYQHGTKTTIVPLAWDKASNTACKESAVPNSYAFIGYEVYATDNNKQLKKK